MSPVFISFLCPDLTIKTPTKTTPEMLRNISTLTERVSQIHKVLR